MKTGRRSDVGWFSARYTMLLTQSSIMCIIAGPSVFFVLNIKYPNAKEIGIKLTALATACMGSKPTANILCGK